MEKEMLHLNNGNIPSFLVEAETIPEAWEKAVILCWEKGIDIRTEYDRKDADGRFIVPPSRDASITVVVQNPFAEPRIHKNFPGGPEELEVYRQEVIDGIHDHWVDPSDPDKWTYTYHQRFFAYQPTTDVNNPNAVLRNGFDKVKPVNQLDYIVSKLSSSPYSRRAQAVTWMPTADPSTEDPPCLQRSWFRILPNEQGELVLNLNTSWRSRDGYKAWFMNVYAITDLQRIIAEQISQKMGTRIKVGRYRDDSDSFHIYGSYHRDFLLEYEKMKSSSWKTRTWESSHPAFTALTNETKEKLKQNSDYMKKT